MKRNHTLQLLLFFVLGFWSFFSQANAFYPQSPERYLVKEFSIFEINSAITPATLDYLRSQLPLSPTGSLVIIKMNTPGGLISTTKEIMTLISSQEKPIVIWVTPAGASAASAGALISAAAHFIVMTPGSHMGAATPVNLGSDIKENDGRAKILNDLKASVRSFSELRGRPGKPFEEMIEAAKTFTDQEAKNAGFIDGTMTEVGQLKILLSGKSFKFQNRQYQVAFDQSILEKSYPPTQGQKLLSILADPSLAYFIFLFAIALIYFEFQAPGGYIAGGIGFILLTLSAISFQVLPLNWGALLLVLVGIILLIMEFYITSYGLLGLGGFAAFMAGSLFLFHDNSGYISVNYSLVFSTALGVISAIALISWYLIREKKKLHPVQNFFLPIGIEGKVLQRLDSQSELYQIKVKGEIWRAYCANPLEPGDMIVVSSIDQEKLIATVNKISKESL